VDQEAIQAALSEITAETDATLKSLRLASLCSAVFREAGVEVVVVGGSAIEFYTEGAYTSGDLDLCLISPGSLPLRRRQELMGQLQAEGGPRSWRVAGLFVDLLGQVESFARTQSRQLDGPYGIVEVFPPEDLLVERVLVSTYPSPNSEARDCARKLLAVVLRGQLEMDWPEVRRLAALPEYDNLADCERLVAEVSDEIGVENPLHS
jgi:hypothetical protein